MFSSFCQIQFKSSLRQRELSLSFIPGLNSTGFINLKIIEWSFAMFIQNQSIIKIFWGFLFDWMNYNWCQLWILKLQNKGQDFKFIKQSKKWKEMMWSTKEEDEDILEIPNPQTSSVYGWWEGRMLLLLFWAAPPQRASPLTSPAAKPAFMFVSKSQVVLPWATLTEPGAKATIGSVPAQTHTAKDTYA